MNKFAEWVQKNGVQKNRLADEMGVHPRTIARWEQGKTRPEFEQMISIARITNLEILPNDWIRPGELGDFETVGRVVVVKTDPVHLTGRQRQAIDDLPLPRPM